MISTFSLADLPSASPRTLSDTLEKGTIAFFPDVPIGLPAADELEFLRNEMPRLIESKNVSYHPETKHITGIDAASKAGKRAEGILRAHSERVQSFLRAAMPELTEGWTVGTSSFRPLEEKGRGLGPHASNELVHVDAGAYGATHGDRILRFFININPDRDRVWTTKGIFPELYERFGRAAGIASEKSRSLERGPWNAMYSGILKTFKKGRLIDTSPYDRLMRQFHNYMKDTPEFQNDSHGHREFRFPPFSAWMVFTDMVSHACIEGQYALVDTFVIPLRNCRLPELAPFHILRGSHRAISH